MIPGFFCLGAIFGASVMLVVTGMCLAIERWRP